tara:strand:+ start:12532 stop:13122 length:591 start_codon:yes stop_codon:yes gene_type:complete
MKITFYFLSILMLFILMTSCQKTGLLTRYGIFHVKNDSTVTMNGVIGGRTDNQFNNLLKNHTNLRWIELGYCPGSKDDEVNLVVAKQMHDLGINTQVSSASEIASGAVDFFLAGNKRIVNSGAQIGVHSWAGDNKVPAELKVDAIEHDLYINFYKSVGMSDSEAREFYFFTILSAESNDIHWMTSEEIKHFDMATD